MKKLTPEDKFKTNLVARKIRHENNVRAIRKEQADLARKMGTEESVEMIKESLPKYRATTEQPLDGYLYIDGYTEGFEDGCYEYKKMFFIGLTLGSALGILFAHFLVVMPNLS